MRLIDAVEKSSRRFPTTLALVDQARSLTYERLWDEVDTLAAEFQAQDRRAIILKGQRSVSLILRFLAVLKAKHIPLLLDPCTPAGRLQELEALLEPWRGDQSVEYLATTSGSAGRPKIVRIGFSSLCSVVKQQIEVLNLGPGSRSAWLLSPGFDASLSDIGTALCSGATLLCTPCGVERDLAQYLKEHQVTYLDIPPSILAVYQPGEFPATLKTLVVGGEPSDPQVLRDWSKFHRVVAVYGPTETTVCTSLSLVDEQWDAPYIGQPLQGVHYRVEDSELLIGGEHLGLGYLDSDFHDWYATGDLVGDCHPEHGYRFLGRQDRQIQLHGQRVELDEIETRAAVILGHRNVAVLEHKGGLALIWQSQHCVAQDERTLRQQLAEQLLPAWLPKSFVALKSLSRTSSQKIDRQALLALLDGQMTTELDSLASLDLLVRLERAGIAGASRWISSRETLALDKKTLSHQLPTLSTTRKKAQQGRLPRVLVTGLTGRLGQALAPLLADFDVWTLTRRPQGPQDIFADLEQPDFGIPRQTWEMLKNEIDLVFNLAGRLELSSSFEELKQVNALALARLTELGCPIHHASTMAVTLSAEGDTLFGGYAQSKWLAEQILVESDWPGNTFRFGQLLGQPDQKELLALVVTGLRDLGMCPRSREGLFFDITPIDWAAQILRDELLRSLDGRTTHCVRRGWQASYQELVRILGQNFGVKEVDSREFFRRPAVTPASAVAQRALWKCSPDPDFSCRWRDFDLFLLSNSEDELESTEVAARELKRYLSVQSFMLT